MDEHDLEVRVVELEYNYKSLEKRLDQHVRRLDAVSLGLDDIKKILLQIKWIGIGVLVGAAMAAGDKIPAIIKFLTVAV